MSNTYFGHFALKFDYNISRFFLEKSLSELKTQHRLWELEQILQSPALAVLQ